MGRQSVLTQLNRLELLTAALKAEDCVTASALAAQLGVSQRTIARDLNVLRARHLPIEADRGAGGGIRLHRNWRETSISLDQKEAIDALLCFAIAESLGSALFLQHIPAVRLKVTTLFSTGQRDNIKKLRRRILIGAPASKTVMSSYSADFQKASPELFAAFINMKRVMLTYQDNRGSLTQRLIEPQYLFLNWPVWYLFAWDHLRSDGRCFRLDRVKSADIDPSTFKLHPATRFDPLIAQIGGNI